LSGVSSFVTKKARYRRSPKIPLSIGLLINQTETKHKPKGKHHMNIQDALGKAIDQANEQIDTMANVATTEDYMASLEIPQTGSYLVRPDGSIEFIKH